MSHRIITITESPARPLWAEAAIDFIFPVVCLAVAWCICAWLMWANRSRT